MTRPPLEPSPLRVIIVAAVLLALGGGLWLWRAGSAREGNASVPANEVVRATAAVQLTDAQWQTLDIRTATTASLSTLAVADAVVTVDERATVPVFSSATGRVTAVAVDAGQEVRRGQTLAYVAGVETAQAGSDLAAATAQARTADRQLALSREVVARQQALLDAGGGAAKDWHQSQSDLIAAEGAKHIADATLVAARVKAMSVGADTSAPDGVASPARLLAPIDGQVIQRQVAAGQFISSLAAGGAVPLFTVSDLRRVWVVGSLGEREGSTLHVGQAVEISTMSTSRPIRSVVAWIAPAVDPQTRRVQFRAEIANADQSLKPQMTARIRVFDAKAVPTIAIPNTAIIHDGEDAHCYVATASRALTSRNLTLGRTQDGLTEVLSGLKAGERVITRGAIFVDTLAEGAAQ